MANTNQIGNSNQNTAILQGNTVHGNVNITQITGKSLEYQELRWSNFPGHKTLLNLCTDEQENITDSAKGTAAI